jgi:hypothetical protein
VKGRRCDGCSETIGPTQTAVWATVSVNWMSVWLHVECFELWNTERLRVPHGEPAEAKHLEGQSAARAGTPIRVSI